MNLKYAIKHKKDHEYKNILPLLEPQWLKLRELKKKTEENEQLFKTIAEKKD